MAQKAEGFYDIPNFVDKKAIITEEDFKAFYVDFSGHRGDFQDKRIFRYFGINPNTFQSHKRDQKRILFLAGHRGSGKTTEFNRITSKIRKHAQEKSGKNYLYPVMFDIESALDINNLEFVDILLYMIEKLVKTLEEDHIEIPVERLQPFYDWFSQRIEEINDNEKSQFNIEMGVEVAPTIPFLSKLFFKARTSLSGTTETKEIIRSTFINKISDFILKLNEFLMEVAVYLDQEGKAQDLLFIIDGIEKIGTLELRKKVLLDNANLLQSIQANMIISLPIELMREQANLSHFSEIISFPVIKIQERDAQKGEYINDVIELFKKFVYKRINRDLFTSDQVVEMIIQYSGGAPRELLRIIDQAYMKADEDIIDKKAVLDAVKHLSHEVANYLTQEHFDTLRDIRNSLISGKEIIYSNPLQELLEKRAIYEYNSGNYKRVNPMIAASKIYQDQVG